MARARTRGVGDVKGISKFEEDAPKAGCRRPQSDSPWIKRRWEKVVSRSRRNAIGEVLSCARDAEREGEGDAPGRVVHGRHVHQRLVQTLAVVLEKPQNVEKVLRRGVDRELVLVDGELGNELWQAAREVLYTHPGPSDIKSSASETKAGMQRWERTCPYS